MRTRHKCYNYSLLPTKGIVLKSRKQQVNMEKEFALVESIINSLLTKEQRVLIVTTFPV